MDEKKDDRLKAYEGSVLDQGYGVVGKRVMRDRTIKIGAKGLYCYLCVYGHNVFPKRDTICRDLNISRDTYNSYLKELIDRGYVSVRQQRGEGNRFSSNLYTINIKIPAVSELVNDPQRKISATEESDPQEPWQEKPCTEKSATEKPCTDNSATEEETRVSVAEGVMGSQEGANTTNSNNTSLKQYKNTTTADIDKVNIKNGGFSSAGEILNVTMTHVQEAKQTAVVVDDEIKALMVQGESIQVDRKTVLFFVKRYGKEAVKTQLDNLGYAVKRGQVDNPGGWLNAALKNGYSNLAAEKAKVKHDEVAREQEAIRKMLEADRNKPQAQISEDNPFYQVYMARVGKKAEG